MTLRFDSLYYSNKIKTKNDNMKKYKAVQLMREGKKITHRHFSPDEWMTIQDGELLLEDGVKCSFHEFWKWRTDASWNDGYSLYGE